MESVKETASFTLGMISVFIWVVAEIPQIMTNYRAKSAEGLSITFLDTLSSPQELRSQNKEVELAGSRDLFNFFGCLLEPATLPTQLYMAVLYTIITVVLGAQSIYYGHIYPQLKYKRQIKVPIPILYVHSKHEQVETPTNVGQSNSGEKKASDGEEKNGFDDYNGGTGRSSPIPFPAHPRGISTGRELFYQSARYLSKSHTPTAGSLLAQRMIPSSPTLDSIQENLLGSAAATQSAPALKIKNTLCLVSILTILGGINMLQSLDRTTNHMVSNPRQESVIYVGRKLFQVLQVGSDQLTENGASGGSSIGTFLGTQSFDVSLCFNWERHLCSKHTYDQLGLVKTPTKPTMAGRFRRMCPS
ncbi:hypothetical protein Lal_00045778 [Lupinus albus]|nr:hypothetical protein Lal_00045778 [Lupinus albus]